jgi:hypothetical protein
MEGQPANADIIAHASPLAMSGAKPLPMTGYKLALLVGLVRDVMERIAMTRSRASIIRHPRSPPCRNADFRGGPAPWALLCVVDRPPDGRDQREGRASTSTWRI